MLGCPCVQAGWATVPSAPRDLAASDSAAAEELPVIWWARPGRPAGQGSPCRPHRAGAESSGKERCLSRAWLFPRRLCLKHPVLSLRPSSTVSKRDHVLKNLIIICYFGLIQLNAQIIRNSSFCLSENAFSSNTVKAFEVDYMDR